MNPFSAYLLKQSDTKAQWGMMDIHNMVEHIGLTLQMSMGERPVELQVLEEKAIKLKRIMIDSQRPMPKGVKTVMLPNDKTLPYINPSFTEAIDFVEDNLNRFKTKLQTQPEESHLHPTMGLLTMNEWNILHRKHFVHHFEQFGLDLGIAEEVFA